jgi:hypothetical protein
MNSPRSLLLAAVAATFTLPAQAGIKDPYQAGEVLVRLHSSTGLEALLARHQLTLLAQSGARPLYCGCRMAPTCRPRSSRSPSTRR